MPEFLLELFSEEIPARLQAGGAESLARLLGEALGNLSPREIVSFWGPRRIAVSATLEPEVASSRKSERGPRGNAPEAALAGFLRKHSASKDELRLHEGFWLLERDSLPVPAPQLIASVLPGLLRRFPWPKSMRWGESNLTWVRPLRRILCLLDGEVVPFDLAEPDDSGHGLSASNLTEGHRFLAPGPFAVRSLAHWREGLRERYVLVDTGDRSARVREGIAALAATHNLRIVPDEALVEEVAGLVEWPVPMLGAIDAGFMDLPPEMMQVSMRVNQRYFALCHADRSAAPAFAFIANTIPAAEGAALVVAGNERVLRARFADARHFWDLDRATKLAARVPALADVTFHAAVGSQAARVARIEALGALIAGKIGADPISVQRAAHLAKADLLTTMVGEFPELQGVMGEYYARHDGEPEAVQHAIRAHYLPRGLNDATPHDLVSIAVALADRIDSLVALFAAGEKPSGSGDPYALRRAALGVIRIIREHGLRVDLFTLFDAAAANLPETLRGREDLALLAGFIGERLRIQLRTQGARHDVLAAVAAAGLDGDLNRLLARTDAVGRLLGSEDGSNLLAAGKRAANILRIEEKKDGRQDTAPDPALYTQGEEHDLAHALDLAAPVIGRAMAGEDYDQAMLAMAGLRAPLDRFFNEVTVNATDPAVRSNRLRLLARMRAMLGQIADFSLIED